MRRRRRRRHLTAAQSTKSSAAKYIERTVANSRHFISRLERYLNTH
jgi:hypothetical protein